MKTEKMTVITLEIMTHTDARNQHDTVQQRDQTVMVKDTRRQDDHSERIKDSDDDDGKKKERVRDHDKEEDDGDEVKNQRTIKKRKTRRDTSETKVKQKVMIVVQTEIGKALEEIRKMRRQGKVDKIILTTKKVVTVNEQDDEAMILELMTEMTMMVIITKMKMENEKLRTATMRTSGKKAQKVKEVIIEVKRRK